MESSNLKNMVVLKNLPSNIVDEAIIILKNSKKIKKLKEAEMLVNSYVSKMENKENKSEANKKIKQNYKKLKKYALISTIVCLTEFILLITL